MHNIFDIPATTQSFRTVSLRRGDEGGGTDTILHTRGHDARFSDVFPASRHGKGATPHDQGHDPEFQDSFFASRHWETINGKGRSSGEAGKADIH